jgi:hypothetical protein
LRDVKVNEHNSPWIRIEITDDRGADSGAIFNCKPGAIAHPDELVLSTFREPEAVKPPAPVAAASAAAVYERLELEPYDDDA